MRKYFPIKDFLFLVPVLFCVIALMFIKAFDVLKSARIIYSFSFFVSLVAFFINFILFHDFNLAWYVVIFYFLFGSLFSFYLPELFYGIFIANYIPSFFILLGFVWIISIIIEKPFSIYYAKKFSPEEFWTTEEFRKINFIISLVWGGGFILVGIISLLFKIGYIRYIIAFIPLLVCMRFTKTFPRRYLGFFPETRLSKTKEGTGTHVTMSDDGISVEQQLRKFQSRFSPLDGGNWTAIVQFIAEDKDEQWYFVIDEKNKICDLVYGHCKNFDLLFSYDAKDIADMLNSGNVKLLDLVKNSKIEIEGNKKHLPHMARVFRLL